MGKWLLENSLGERKRQCRVNLEISTSHRFATTWLLIKPASVAKNLSFRRFVGEIRLLGSEEKDVILSITIWCGSFQALLRFIVKLSIALCPFQVSSANPLTSLRKMMDTFTPAIGSIDTKEIWLKNRWKNLARCWSGKDQIWNLKSWKSKRDKWVRQIKLVW